MCQDHLLDHPKMLGSSHSFLRYSRSSVYERYITMFVIMQAVQHQLLNYKENPCMDFPDYKYQNCMIHKIIDSIGCQPYWVNISQSHETCTELKDLKTFLERFKSTSKITASQINDKFGCLKPCTFIEYQVCGQCRIEPFKCWDFLDCRTANVLW